MFYLQTDDCIPYLTTHESNKMEIYTAFKNKNKKQMHSG